MFSLLLPANASGSVIHGNKTLCQNQKNVVFTVDAMENVDEYDWSYDGKGVQLSSNGNVLYMNVTDSIQLQEH